MQKIILPMFILVLVGTGCSTIVSPTKSSVEVTSIVDGQEFRVEDNEGAVVAKAKTPSVIKLDNEGESTFTYITACQTKLEKSKVNGWVWGNILFGGIIGLAVDLTKGYSNEPVNKVSLENCNKIPAEVAKVDENILNKDKN